MKSHNYELWNPFSACHDIGWTKKSRRNLDLWLLLRVIICVAIISKLCHSTYRVSQKTFHQICLQYLDFRLLLHVIICVAIISKLCHSTYRGSQKKFHQICLQYLDLRLLLHVIICVRLFQPDNIQGETIKKSFTKSVCNYL